MSDESQSQDSVDLMINDLAKSFKILKNEDELQSQEYLEDIQDERALTAPARPLTDIEEFRRSDQFNLLEQTVLCQQELSSKQSEKYDFDTIDGQKIGKKYLKLIEKLLGIYKCKTASRDYRNGFSKAYKILYNQESLCYLTEILDSAQEAFPYLWVNGEKYIFSTEVLDAGKRLFSSFCKIQHVIRNVYTRACQDNSENCLQQITQEISCALQKFDTNWVTFEQLYVLELMLIEADARRFISDAIEIEKELKSMEIREKAKGRIVYDTPDYTKKRGELAIIMGQINSVANSEGKGRDDLKIEILVSSEGILRRISPDQSKAVRQLAEQIRNSFSKFRQLMRKYEENIEVVDPQLKNNPELVTALVEYEKSWEKGKRYFLNEEMCNQIIHFSQIIEATIEKYNQFEKQIECRDANIFVTIPSLVILKFLEKNDEGIAKTFLPNISDPNGDTGKIIQKLIVDYEQANEINKGNSFKFYNMLEKLILGIDFKEEDKQLYENNKQQIDNINNKVKRVSMELMRHKPQDWNNFMDALLSGY